MTPATASDFAFRWVCTWRSRGLPDELEADAAVGPRQTIGLRVAAFRAGRWDDGVAHVDAGGLAPRCACAVNCQDDMTEWKPVSSLGPDRSLG